MTIKEDNAPLDLSLGRPIRHILAMTLPLSARKALMEAAALDSQMPIGESILRTRALDTVIERIKEAYPECFIEGRKPTAPTRFVVPSFMDRSHK